MRRDDACPALPGAVWPRAAASLGIPLLQAGGVEGEYPKERLLEDCVVVVFFFLSFTFGFFLEGRYEKIARVQPVPWSAQPGSADQVLGLCISPGESSGSAGSWVIISSSDN